MVNLSCPLHWSWKKRLVISLTNCNQCAGSTNICSRKAYILLSHVELLCATHSSKHFNVYAFHLFLITALQAFVFISIEQEWKLGLNELQQFAQKYGADKSQSQDLNPGLWALPEIHAISVTQHASLKSYSVYSLLFENGI